MSHPLQNIFDKHETYSLQLVTSWLKENKIPFVYSSPDIEYITLYQHGVKIKYKDTFISVQTHPTVAGWAFAETLILDNIAGEADRHETPEGLFNYINSKLKSIN